MPSSVCAVPARRERAVDVARIKQRETRGDIDAGDGSSRISLRSIRATLASGGGLSQKSVIGTLSGAAVGGLLGFVGAGGLSEKAGADFATALNARLGANESMGGQLSSQGATALYESGGDVSSLGNVDFSGDPVTTALGAIGGPVSATAGSFLKSSLVLRNRVVGQTVEKEGQKSTAGYLTAAVVEGA